MEPVIKKEPVVEPVVEPVKSTKPYGRHYLVDTGLRAARKQEATPI